MGNQIYRTKFNGCYQRKDSIFGTWFSKINDPQANVEDNILLEPTFQQDYNTKFNNDLVRSKFFLKTDCPKLSKELWSAILSLYKDFYEGKFLTKEKTKKRDKKEQGVTNLNSIKNSFYNKIIYKTEDKSKKKGKNKDIISLNKINHNEDDYFWLQKLETKEVTKEKEVTVVFQINNEGKWRVIVPQQIVNYSYIIRENKRGCNILTGEIIEDFFLDDNWKTIGDSHLHPFDCPYFSYTDDKSDKYMPGIHILVSIPNLIFEKDSILNIDSTDEFLDIGNSESNIYRNILTFKQNNKDLVYDIIPSFFVENNRYYLEPSSLISETTFELETTYNSNVKKFIITKN